MKIRKNKSIIGILAVLMALLLINPVTAVNNQNNINQTVILPIQEFVGFSLSTNIITFNVDGLGTTITTPTYYITNLGNVPIDLSVKANNDFIGSNEQINLTDGYYAIICQDITTLIETNNTNIFKTGLNPQRHKESKEGTISLYQRFTIPYGTTPGTYNTTLTYTAMKTRN